VKAITSKFLTCSAGGFSDTNRAETFYLTEEEIYWCQLEVRNRGNVNTDARSLTGLASSLIEMPSSKDFSYSLMVIEKSYNNCTSL
jgi:hypothetical protein